MKVETNATTEAGKEKALGESRTATRIVVTPVTDVLMLLSMMADDKKCEYNELQEMVGKIRGNLRPRLLANIEKFFQPNCYPGLGLLSLIGTEHARDVPTLLQALNTLPDEELARALLAFGRIFRGNMPPQRNIQDLLSDRAALLEHIEQHTSVPTEKINELADIILNPADARENLGELIEHFWYIILQPEAEQRAEQQQKIAELCQARLREVGPLKLINAMSHLHLTEESDYAEIIFAPNTIAKLSLVGTENEDSNSMIMAFGEENVNEKPSKHEDADESKLDIKNLAELYNTLGEEIRLKIVQMLVERPHYGQELAKMLGKTNATVFYHLSMLEKKGIVYLERIEHRVYYVLNTELLRRLLVRGTELLVK